MHLKVMILLGRAAEKKSTRRRTTNDFYFTEIDFFETRNQLNDATKHFVSYKQSCDKIKSIGGHKVLPDNRTNDNAHWTVVKSDAKNDDAFCLAQSEEIGSMEEKIIPMKRDNDPDKFSAENDFNSSFWSLWPTTNENDLMKLNEAIITDNDNRKQN